METKELNKIFDNWYSEAQDTPEIKKHFCTLLEYLYNHCEEQEREKLMDNILALMECCSKHSFYSGYVSAYNLCIEIITFQSVDIL